MANLAALVLASIGALAVAPAVYSVVAELPAGDGGWDLVSVDPVDQRV